LKHTGDGYEIETPAFDLRINKATGDFSRLYAKSAHWNVFGDASDADAFELLGDNGTAWTIRYTGADKILSGEGARVTILDDGPVFARARESHFFGKSSYTRDIIVYGALDRIDIPTAINWREKAELLKIRLPINATHIEAAAQIPFGSKARPTNGQECPGQEWMDVSATVPVHVTNAVRLDLSPFFNSQRADNFDGEGGKYSAWLLPEAGVHRLGSYQAPFNLPGYHADQPDNVAAAGQEISIPGGANGDTLFLLAARSKGIIGTDIGFRFPDGNTEFRAFDLNNWKVDAFADNEVGFAFSMNAGGTTALPEPGIINAARAHRRKRGRGTVPTMWIVEVPIPQGASALVLPRDDGFHLFAATVAANPQAPATYGLSVLNDSKYGFDVTHGVFRLTALRSSGRPDPDPDDGIQQFTYSLYPHPGDWAAARTDERARGLNIPLLAVVTTPHPPARQVPRIALENAGAEGDLIVTALKKAEDGNGYILRFYEADGQDTRARIHFDEPMRVTETDILERPLVKQAVENQGDSATLPVGHNRIVTVRFVPVSS
ncbi:MAG: glycoside hydrolase family 38 C-terminal domain-containing protein, partial [Limisphaerales bacterium]